MPVEAGRRGLKRITYSYIRYEAVSLNGNPRSQAVDLTADRERRPWWLLKDRRTQPREEPRTGQTRSSGVEM